MKETFIYQKWASHNGERGISKKEFGQQLEERGFTPRRGGKGKRLWVGLRLHSIEEPEYEPIQGEFDDVVGGELGGVCRDGSA